MSNLSFRDYPNQTGDVTVYTVPDKISRKHITALVDGVSVPFTWLTGQTIEITPAPVGNVRIQRTTPSDAPLVEFQAGSVQSASRHNRQARQTLYVVQEAQDKFAQNMLNDGTEWDGLGLPMGNLGDPVSAAQAATRGWTEAAIEAAKGVVDLPTALDIPNLSQLPTDQIIRTSGYAVAGDRGAAEYGYSPTEPDHGAKFQDDDGQWWELISAYPNAAMFGAVGVDTGPGTATVDAYQALQNGINFVKKSKNGKKLDLLGLRYGISGTLRLNSGDSGITNGAVEPLSYFTGTQYALPDSEVIEPLLVLDTGLRNSVSHMTFDCQGIADGIYRETQGFKSKYHDIEIDNFKAFGFRVEGSGDQHFSSILISQTSGSDTTGRTGIALDLQTGDLKLDRVISRYARIALRANANTNIYDACHFYNGSPSGTVQNTTNIEITGGSGQTFIGCYMDKGRIVMRGSFSHQFVGCKLLYDSVPDHTSVFVLDAMDEVDRAWPDELVIEPFRTTVPVANGNMQFLQFVSSGSGNWSSAAQAVRDVVNNNNTTLRQNDGAAVTVFDKNMRFTHTSGVQPLVLTGTAIYAQDSGINLGAAFAPWDNIHATNGTIQTSDREAKKDFGDIPSEWLDAWAEVKWQRFRMQAAKADKGESARWHVGLVAQEIEEAFARHGVDAREIGLLCVDQTPNGPVYGVRYDEAQALEAAYVRRLLTAS